MFNIQQSPAGTMDSPILMMCGWISRPSSSLLLPNIEGRLQVDRKDLEDKVMVIEAAVVYCLQVVDVVDVFLPPG